MSIAEQEKQWRESSRLSTKEILNMFPEAEKIIKEQLKYYKNRLSLVEADIKLQKTKLQRHKADDFTLWFWEYLTDFQYENEVKNIRRHIVRLQRELSLLHPELQNKGMITDEQIMGAKEVPIEQFLEYKCSSWNNRIKARCPFHDDRTPSLFVYQEQNTFWCFGCHKGGDSIQFIQLLHGLSFPEAVRHLI